MMSSRRSASVGALPHEKKHFVSRTESIGGASLDVRCACQYFESDSLLPERVNPVESRPSSKLGFHGEFGSDHEHFDRLPNDRMDQFHPMNSETSMHIDNLSNRSFNVAGHHHTHPVETDRLSMRNIGAQRSWEQPTAPPIDLAFVEKYPELEETARARGLIVRSISEATEGDLHGAPTSGTFMAGHRLRQLSVGGLSSMRDPETMSVRSVTSVRRISRSPSKSDLFVADINIPQVNRRDQRSASASRRTSNVDLANFASRRTSNVDLTHFTKHQATPTPLFVDQILPQQQQTLTAPQLNFIAPTPSPAVADMRPDFSRALTPMRSTSPPAVPQDYRVAKRPLSTDYMRPDTFQDPGYHAPGGDVLPQHRPIDMSKYNDKYENPVSTAPAETLNLQTAFKASSRAASPAPFDSFQQSVPSKIYTPFKTSSRAASPTPLDPLQQTVNGKTPMTFQAGSRGASPVPLSPLEQTVAVLEAIAATHNVLDIYDNIKSESYRPPSIAGDINLMPPNVDEETRIDIKTIIPSVDIDALVQSERQKAADEQNKPKPLPRHKSPPSRRPKSPPPPPQNTYPSQMDTLQLPATRSHTQSQTQLKRQHTPERNLSPENSKRTMRQSPLHEPQPIEMHAVNINGAIPLQEASAEAKSTYASRFKSMFITKNNAPPKEPSPNRQKSPSPVREKSVSPIMGRSSSSPSKLMTMTMFTKSKPEAIQLISGTNTAVTRKKPEAEPLSVRVTETFSLKVDEMDQYSSHPTKPPPPPPASSLIGNSATPAHSIYSSREDFPSFDRASADISEPFTPVVISGANRAQFLAGNRSLYSSEIDMTPRRSETELRHVGGSRTPSIGPSIQHTRGQLISVPINIGGSGEVAHLPPLIGGSTQRLTGFSRAPSEQRVLQSKLGRKPSFTEGRTQSQDRARITGSHEDLYGGSRMAKTVSFNFGERNSRLSEFENVNISQQQKDQRDFLERTYFTRDHEYEPIGEPLASEEKPSIIKEPSPAPFHAHVQNQESMEVSTSRDDLQAAEDIQKDLEERYFSSATTTPRTESRTDYEIHTSQVDSSALEELPLKPENRKKGFMASAQDRTRKMQAGIKTQAGKIKTKLRTPAKKSPSSSPKTKERKRFKAPEFSKMRMPEIKRPDMSKLKDFKRPEFTKFNKPDMSKFKLPEKFSTLKLRRSKSFKENENAPEDDEMTGDVVADPSGAATADAAPQQKKMFEFNFGTYPRAFRKKKKPVEPEPSFETGTATEGPSVVTSTGTQPSMESSSSPQGDRGPGPVRSRWADKFSDVSYNDSEGSRYRRYGSEQESFDRESSLERRMREDLEDAASEEAATNLGILGGVTNQKQFAEFDEENRAIHEISNLRAGEFKRRPMVHQDSDLISEEGKEPVGWTDKEVQKNKLLRKAELEAEASYLNHPPEEGITQETQSTASSEKKVVMEEINDDEFFLRKRGVSEDNIELRQYISTAIREGFDMPINALQHVGRSSEPMEYGDYDVPPPKPRRLHKAYRPDDISQDFDIQRSEYDDDMSLSQNGSDFLGAPKRPMRKGHSRSKYSMDSQDIPMADQHHEQYFDDDEEYLRPPPRIFIKGDDGDEKINNLDIVRKEGTPQIEDAAPTRRPQAPRRRKRQQRDLSVEKEAYINGFGGRSVSNSFLQPTEDVIVYRTEHEYHIPLATPENYTDGASAASRKSRSLSRFDDDRTSHGADSIAMDNILRNELEAPERQPLSEDDAQEKFIIDMMENDGYAIVRKEHIPKPTPPARRKKFSRSPGERFATMPNMRTKRGSPTPPERPPPPRGYSPAATAEPIPPRRKSALSLDEPQNVEDDYEEPELLDHERPESPRNLQSGDIINKMKYRPLPAPPRPPREKKQRGASGKGFMQDNGQDEQESNFDDRDGGGERIATSSTADSYDQNGDFEDDPHFVEVEVSTQTDPLPDDFICEEFEITEDMKIIEPRRPGKTLEDLLKEEQEELERNRPLTEDEQLAKGLQKFRDANQRSLSEKSRSDRSRPQTPSAVIIERRVSTPIPNRDAKESMLEAALIVRPIDDLDLEEEELRREGLLTDSSQQSKSDVEEEQILASDFSRGPSSIELEEAIESLRSQVESERETEDDKEVELTMQEHPFEYYKHEETHLTLGHRDDESDEEQKRGIITMTDVEYKKERTPPPSYEEGYGDYFKEEISDDPTNYDYDSNLNKELELEEESGLENETEVEITQVLEQRQDSTPPLTPEELQRSYSEEQAEPLQQSESSQSGEPSQQSQSLKWPEPLQQTEQIQEQSEPPIPLPSVPPQAPPRRRSTTVIEPTSLAILEQQIIQEIAPQQSVLEQPALPTHMAIADLEVERLRVHALQAGQIMVSQLHGTQISSDELECKSGSLIVKNIELPPGFIEDIVERVRTSERGQLQAAETQTTPKSSQELLDREESPPTVRELVPPPKPPRQKDLEAAVAATQIIPDPSIERARNLDEDTATQSTQTLETATTSSPPPPPFPTVEYLQSLAPLAFYNLRNIEQDELNHRRRRHHRRSRESSPSEEDNERTEEDLIEHKDSNEADEQPIQRHRRRTRSVTRPSSEPQQSVAQAGRQFLSACSLSLVNIINQLTDSVRDIAKKETDAATRSRQVPTLVVLFILITFGILLFLLSGKSVHHHHWDYFNPPGNDGRLS